MGDEIIASGQARALYARTGRKAMIVGRDGRPRMHELWQGNPHIAAPYERCEFTVIKNGPGERPYIAEKSADRWTWKTWTCPRGELYLTPQEKAFGAQFPDRVILEPHNKPKASPNKQWGWVRWNKLAWLLQNAGVKVTQVGPAGTPLLDGAELVQTSGFRLACAVLARAAVAILPEGGLHHAAAALGTPAVVIFGGFISPAQTGYDDQINYFTGGVACGKRVPCEHCARAMAAITPEDIAAAALATLAGVTAKETAA